MNIQKKKLKKSLNNDTHHRDLKPGYEASAWRPECSSLTRSEFQQIVMEIIG